MGWPSMRGTLLAMSRDTSRSRMCWIAAASSAFDQSPKRRVRVSRSSRTASSKCGSPFVSPCCECSMKKYGRPRRADQISSRPRIHQRHQLRLDAAVAGEAGHLAGVAMRVEAEQRGHELVVVAEREGGVEVLRARREAAALRVEEAARVRVADAVHRHDLGLVEAGRVVRARGVAGVMVHVHARAVREDAAAVVLGAAEGDVGELLEALRMDVLELAVRGVPERELKLAREALREREPAVHEPGSLRVELRLEPGGGETRPTALHLDAREPLLGDRVQRPSRGVDRHDAGLVAAVVPDPHRRLRSSAPLANPAR